MRVVEALDELEDGHASFRLGPEPPAVQQLTGVFASSYRLFPLDTAQSVPSSRYTELRSSLTKPETKESSYSSGSLENEALTTLALP